MSTSAPDAFDRLGAALSERTSPIVVKEIRQGLRTRVFWIFFALMLIAWLIIALVAFAAKVGDAGQGAFIATFLVLSVVQFFVIPFSAYRSMARERDEETWVLLTLTGLGPRRVIRGKIGSFVLQGVLYASAAAPFLLFSYYLNGIGLPAILVSLVFAAGYQVFLVSISVSLSTVAQGKLMRSLMQFVVLAVLLQALGLGMAGGPALGEAFRNGSVHAEFYFGLVCTLFAMLSTSVLLFEAAAAGLSLVTENYTRGPRLAFIVQALGAAVLVVIGSQAFDADDAIAVASVLFGVYAMLVGLYVGSDRDGLAKNLQGIRGSLLSPGAYRAYLVVIVMTLLIGGAFFTVALTTSISVKKAQLIGTMPAFALLYLSLPQIIARWLPHGPSQTPAMVRIVGLALLLLGSGVPPLMGALVATPDDSVLNVFNPVIGLANIGKSDEVNANTFIVWAAAIVSVVVAGVMLKRRDVDALSHGD